METVQIGSTRYEIIEEIGTWDYDWQIGALLREPTTASLFFAYDSGCSCTSFGDGLTEDDLTPVASAAEAVDKAKDATWSWDGGSRIFSDVEVAEFAKRLLF